MKKILIAIALLVSLKGNAQKAASLNISLAQALEQGVANRYDIKANNINVGLANNAVQKAKKEWLPDITASPSVRYNTQLQKMIFPDGFGASNQPSTIEIGTKNQTLLSLDLTQNIYKPGLNTDIKIAKNEALLEQEKNREKTISIKQSIAQAYLNAILKKLQLNLLDSAAARYAGYYKLADDRYKLQAIIYNDLLKAKLDYGNAEIAAQKAKQNYELAIAQLKYQLNIGGGQEIILTDSIESLQGKDAIYPGSVNASGRTEIKQLLLQAETNKLQLLKSKQYVLPTISLVANYTYQFQYDNFDYGKSNVWSPFNYVTLKLAIPITGNIKNYNSIKDYKLKLEQNNFQLLQKQKDIAYELEKTATELLNAQVTMRSTKGSLELSANVYQTQLEQYKFGVLTYSSVLDTETSINTAEQNYVEAVYNYLVAKINYEKARGIL